MCAVVVFVAAPAVFEACGFAVAEFAGFADATALPAEATAGSEVAVSGGAAIDVATAAASALGWLVGSVAIAGATVCVTAGEVATTACRAACAYHATDSARPAPNPQMTAITAPLLRRGRAGGGTEPCGYATAADPSVALLTCEM